MFDDHFDNLYWSYLKTKKKRFKNINLHKTRENVSFTGNKTVLYQNRQRFLYNSKRSGFSEEPRLTGTNVPFVVITEMLSSLPDWLLVIVKDFGYIIYNKLQKMAARE